jgi:hypothetical protein
VVHPVVRLVPMVRHVLEHPARQFVTKDMEHHREMVGVSSLFVCDDLKVQMKK